MVNKPMRIVVTGSNGDIGPFVLEYARAQGADVLGVDLSGSGAGVKHRQAGVKTIPPPAVTGSYRYSDLTDLGQVYDVLDGADAVINLAAISDPYIFPAARTFITNVAISYNVLLAAARLGIRRIVSASSIQVHHPAFPHVPIHYDYLPFDEDHPPDPHDEYGLSKLVGEQCAETFARHYGLTVVSLRITWSVRPEQMSMFPLHVPDVLPAPARGKRWLPSPFYVDARDCARACYLAATVDLPASTHTPLIISAPDSCLDMPSPEVARRFFPQARILPELVDYASIASGKRAEQVLGFKTQYSWRNQIV